MCVFYQHLSYIIVLHLKKYNKKIVVDLEILLTRLDFHTRSTTFHHPYYCFNVPTHLMQLPAALKHHLSLLAHCPQTCKVTTGRLKKMSHLVLLISWQPSIGFSNCFFLLKNEIHTKILNTKPFLCDIKGPRNLQNKKWF